MLDGTPVYDIKPYIPYTDCQTDATGGFTDAAPFNRLTVEIPAHLTAKTNPQTLSALRGILAEDPRPHYQDDADREYGFDFDGYSIRFKVNGSLLTVTDIARIRR